MRDLNSFAGFYFQSPCLQFIGCSTDSDCASGMICEIAKGSKKCVPGNRIYYVANINAHLFDIKKLYSLLIFSNCVQNQRARMANKIKENLMLTVILMASVVHARRAVRTYCSYQMIPNKYIWFVSIS